MKKSTLTKRILTLALIGLAIGIFPYSGYSEAVYTLETMVVKRIGDMITLSAYSPEGSIEPFRTKQMLWEYNRRYVKSLLLDSYQQWGVKGLEEWSIVIPNRYRTDINYWQSGKPFVHIKYCDEAVLWSESCRKKLSINFIYF